MNRKAMILASGIPAEDRNALSRRVLKDTVREDGSRKSLVIDGCTARSGDPSPETPATLTSFGDEAGGCKIVLHVHGENFCSGDRFYSTVQQRIPAGNYASNEYGPTYRLPSGDSTVVLDDTNLKFRKNTVYSFRVHFHDATPLLSPPYAQFAIRYSDGTYQDWSGKQGKLKDNLISEVSAAGKTVTAIYHRHRAYRYITFLPEDFAIMEGAHTTEDFFAYVGSFLEIPLSEALRGMESGGGYYADRLNYAEKTVTRKIRNAFDDLALAEATAQSGVFRIPLTVRGNLLAPHILSDVFTQADSPDDVAGGTYRAALSEDKSYLYFSLFSGATLDDAVSLVQGDRPTVLYVRGSEGTENLSFTPPAIPSDESVYYELFATVEPRRMKLI